MNPDLQKALAEFLQAALATLQAGGDVAKREIPLLLQERLMWARATSVLWLVVAAASVVYGWSWSGRVWRWARADKSGENIGYATIFTIVLLGATTLPLLALDHALLVWLAPRVYLLQWLRSLL